MSIERIKELNAQLDDLQKQASSLAEQRSAASEFEKEQIKAEMVNVNNRRHPLEQEKQRLKTSLLRDAQLAVDGARATLQSLTDRSSPANNAQQVIDRILQSVDYHAGEFRNSVISELNGNAGSRERATVNFSNPGFLAFALRDAVEASLRRLTDEWLVKQNATTPGELTQARNAMTRAISRHSQIEAL